MSAAVETWRRVFSPTDRARMTRQGIDPETWLPVALAGGQYSADYIIEAHRIGAPVEVAQALAEVCGPNLIALHRDNLTVPVDLIRQVPDELRPCEPGIPASLPEGVTAARLSEIAAHLPEYDVPDYAKRQRRRERCGHVLRIHEAGVTAEIAAEYGSPDDWERVRICVTRGVSPEQARAWAPLYPWAFEALAEGGWTPALLAEVGAEEAERVARWADAGATVDTLAAWQATGLDHHAAAKFIGHGTAPADAMRWDRLGVSGVDLEWYFEGVTIKQAEAASAAGLRINFRAPAVIRTTPPDVIRAWADLFDAHPVGASLIAGWSAAGFTPGTAAGWWGRRKILERQGVNVPIMRFIAEHVSADEVRPGVFLLGLATARALGIGIDKVPGDVKACRTAFTRRRRPVPWESAQ